MSLLLEEMVCFKPRLVHCRWPWSNKWATATESRGKKQWKDNTNVTYSMMNLRLVKQLLLVVGNYVRPCQSKGWVALE